MTTAPPPNPATPPAPLLKVRDVHHTYRRRGGWLTAAQSTQALKGVSFSLQAGESLGIVGESGSGKSTLARLIMALDAPDSGSIHFKGHNLHTLPAASLRALRPTFQMVFQDPYGSLDPRQRIGRIVTEPLHQSNLDAAALEQRAAQALQAVGLPASALSLYPHEFSGGQRQRIAIARAMMLKPNILVADEPTSALDVSIQAQMLNLFMDLQQELHTAYVFISHNLAVVHHIADDVMVMYKGRIVEYGPKEVVYARPLHPYTQTLLAASPSLRSSGKKNKNTTQGNPRRNYAYATQDGQPEPELHFIQGRLVACHDPQEIIGATEASAKVLP